MSKQQFGVIGLGVMGKNLGYNIERNGYSVAGYDLDPEKLNAFTKHVKDKNVKGFSSIQEFIDHLESPRKILMMVPAGKPVDSVMGDLSQFLSKGDILIDGGNSHFEDTNRRNKEMNEKGILYVGTGISGGEEGALLGPSIMPGGNPDAWTQIKAILQAIAAKADDGSPCCEWMGEEGAGHFVKMVHNGIEYADMQMICEAYFLMEEILGLSPGELHQVFSDWNKGDLNSYLIEITSKIMKKKDAETGKPMIHVILDTAGQKGTGKWTSQVALDFGVPAQTIAEAVFARTISAIKEERTEAAKILTKPSSTFDGNKEEFIEMIRHALYGSKICSYAQGFALLKAANKEFGWTINLGSVATIWRAGCIIRAQFLDRIKEAFDDNPDLNNLLLAPYFKSAIDKNQEPWRKVVATSVLLGVPVPAFSSALAYYDSYRSEFLPANLLQAQRDFFGAHQYERVDKPRNQFFHTEWEG